MIQTFSLHFALKKSKMLADGTAPIYLRITIAGERFELTTKRYIIPSKWNSTTQKMIGNTEDAKAFNIYLKTFERQIYEAHRLMMDRNIPLNTRNLKKQLTGKSDDDLHFLMRVFKEHNERIAALVGKQFSVGTLERYNTAFKHVLGFLQWQYKTDDIDVRDIDPAFVSNFEFFLRKERNCCNNTAIKYLKNAKKIIRICLHNGWINKDPFVHHRAKLTEVIPTFLTAEELKSLSCKVFITERLNQVRDIFLFSCYTGLAYSDVKKLKRSEITLGIDSRKWVMTRRKKTDTVSRIPLLQVALELLQRYENHPQCLNQDRLLPVLSNQKMNAYLKEIAALCNIDKNLTYHAARHTFATTVTLSNGVPIESVSGMLGHKNIRTTQHYAKILDSKLSFDMEKARQKYGG